MNSDTIDESPAPERRRPFLWWILGGIGVALLVIAATILPRALAQLPQLDVEIVAKSLILNARLALHFAQATREFQAVREREAQTVQQDRLGAVGTDYAAKAERAIVGGRGHYVGALDAREFFQ